MSLHTSDYYFELPDELIARHPAYRRDESRMMVLHRNTGEIEHAYFRDFETYLQTGELVVLNDTRVIPARVFSDDGRVEFLFLRECGPNRWQCLVKPGRRMREGAEVLVGGVKGTVEEIQPGGERVVAFAGFIDLERLGNLPLPPYMDREAEDADRERYQTVYARHAGSVAAPTAGLHFTPEILKRVPHAFLTLHVGVGTFRPVQSEDLSEHRMHTEDFCIGAETAAAVNAAHRIVAIGTTTARVLETIGRPMRAMEGSTSIFIHPPHQFQVVGALLTNFHLPKSTLLMLVSAMAGRDFILRAYAEAVAERYRFFSYGDCMLIL